MKAHKYTVNDVRKLLSNALNATAGDEKQTKLVQRFNDYVTSIINHRHQKINHQITSQATRYRLNLKDKQMIDREFNEMVERRNLLIETNQDLRAQLSLSNECPDRSKYCMDPITRRNQKIMLEFDEVKAIGGSTQAEEYDKGYPVINFDEWEDVPEITENDFQKWKNELVSYLHEDVQTQSHAQLEIQIAESDQALSAVTDDVRRFRDNWGEARKEIAELKEAILDQEVLKVQVRTLEDSNNALETEVNRKRGGEVTGTIGEDVFRVSE